MDPSLMHEYGGRGKRARTSRTVTVNGQTVLKSNCYEVTGTSYVEYVLPRGSSEDASRRRRGRGRRRRVATAAATRIVRGDGSRRRRGRGRG